MTVPGCELILRIAAKRILQAGVTGIGVWHGIGHIFTVDGKLPSVRERGQA